MPPSLSEYERLFLLEFYVDYVTIQNIAFDYEESKLCVSFQFLHYPVMRVCEEDFKPETPKPVAEDSKIVFRSGKSCMFSVHPDENNTISSNFNLIITVCQRREGCDRKEVIGQATVNLGVSFLNLLQPSGNFTMDAGTKHDLFPMIDKFKRVVGSVAAFARLSNFGKMIVTQFQLADENNNYMFKGTNPTKLFKDDPAMRDFPKITADEPKRPSEAKEKLSQPPLRSSFKKVELPDSDSSCNDDSSECSDSGESDDSQVSDEKNSKRSIKDENVSKEPGDGENFREIGAEINGHCITIRVVKRRKISSIVTQNLNGVDCNFSAPELTPQCPVQCDCCPQTISSSAKNTNDSILTPQINYTQPEIDTEIDEHIDTLSSTQKESNSPTLVCPREDCPLGLYHPAPPSDPMELEPGCVAMKGDQIFFQMTNRPAGEPVNDKEKKLASSIYYTLGTTEGGKETMGNVVQITPQCAQVPLTECVDGPVSGLPLDCHHDMFLFKIFQENDEINTKSQLEMELRTPKEKYPKPEVNTIDTQYLLTDLPPVEKPVKKGGKKGDGKGGGKKGKKK